MLVVHCLTLQNQRSLVSAKTLRYGGLFVEYHPQNPNNPLVSKLQWALSLQLENDVHQRNWVRLTNTVCDHHAWYQHGPFLWVIKCGNSRQNLWSFKTETFQPTQFDAAFIPFCPFILSFSMEVRVAFWAPGQMGHYGNQTDRKIYINGWCVGLHKSEISGCIDYTHSRLDMLLIVIYYVHHTDSYYILY